VIPVPSDHRSLVSFANDLIEQCQVSTGMRAAYYRLLNVIAETGDSTGRKSLINLLNSHLDRTASHLFSPVELKFQVDFDHPQPPQKMKQAKEVAKNVTRLWECNDTDMTFGQGVYESLKYGAAILKQWPQTEGAGRDEHVTMHDSLVMPWQFGVYREDQNRLDRQEAMVETQLLTMPEVWSRIYNMPSAGKLYEKIISHARSGEASAAPNSFFHQVLSTSQIQTGVQSATRPLPGGIVQLNNDPNYAIMGPVVAAGTVKFHELWVKGDDDYVTLQMIEPDILIEPVHQRRNLLGVHRMHPYSLIQPNRTTNWFWGRSELVDLIEPQMLLSSWAEDARRLFGLQVDKILGFIGEGGMTDELYAQFRIAGWANLGQNAKIEDLTPKIPPEMLPMIKFIIEMINIIGGFPEIMQGRGEPGVRAGAHADTLLKTGSPSLRKRSLLVERQCAAAANTTLSILETKDANKLWLNADQPLLVEDTAFSFADLGNDRRVTIDSHSSSPIFADENTQIIFAGAKLGFVDGEYVLDNMPYPNKEAAKIALRDKQKQQQEFMQKLLQEHPEVGEVILKKQLGSKR